MLYDLHNTCNGITNFPHNIWCPLPPIISDINFYPAWSSYTWNGRYLTPPLSYNQLTSPHPHNFLPLFHTLTSILHDLGQVLFKADHAFVSPQVFPHHRVFPQLPGHGRALSSDVGGWGSSPVLHLNLLWRKMIVVWQHCYEYLLEGVLWSDHILKLRTTIEWNLIDRFIYLIHRMLSKMSIFLQI